MMCNITKDLLKNILEKNSHVQNSKKNMPINQELIYCGRAKPSMVFTTLIFVIKPGKYNHKEWNRLVRMNFCYQIHVHRAIVHWDI